MAVSVIEVKLGGDGSRGSVLIESGMPELSQQIEELTSAPARESVLMAAVKEGIKGQPGISRMVDPPYPLNAFGEDIVDLKGDDDQPLPAASPRMQPEKYRARYEVTARQ